MREKQKNSFQKKVTANDSEVNAEEKTLIQRKGNPIENIDETINTPARYVSWFQSKTIKLDKYLEICPHCKKPTMYAFHRTVIDSAVDYLEGKRMFESFIPHQKNSFPIISFIIVIGTGMYFLINHIVNIFKG